MGQSNQSNVWNEFKKEMGSVNVTNQYIELTKRLFEKTYMEVQISELARNVGLSLTSISTRVDNRIALNYIVGIHRCVESFLLEFKDLPGSPTYGKKYNPENDTCRLEWTVKLCFTSPTEEVKTLKYICEYYRQVRNHSVHTNGSESALNAAFSKIKSIEGSLLESGMSDRLNAPKQLAEIDFDDQVLFSRAACQLCELIYRESSYDWDVVLTSNYEEIKKVSGAVWDNPKKVNRIIPFISRQYPIKDKEEFTNAVSRLK